MISFKQTWLRVLILALMVVGVVFNVGLAITAAAFIWGTVAVLGLVCIVALMLMKKFTNIDQSKFKFNKKPMAQKILNAALILATALLMFDYHPDIVVAFIASGIIVTSFTEYRADT